MCVDDPPVIAVANATPWTFLALEYAPCDDPMNGDTYPFPGMLPPGASFDVPMPAAGCYYLGIVDPGGCLLEMGVNTGDLAACSVFPLDLVEDLFICSG